MGKSIGRLKGVDIILSSPSPRQVTQGKSGLRLPSFTSLNLAKTLSTHFSTACVQYLVDKSLQARAMAAFLVEAYDIPRLLASYLTAWNALEVRVLISGAVEPSTPSMLWKYSYSILLTACSMRFREV